MDVSVVRDTRQNIEVVHWFGTTLHASDLWELGYKRSSGEVLVKIVLSFRNYRGG